jgi:hypothetical protein
VLDWGRLTTPTTTSQGLKVARQKPQSHGLAGSRFTGDDREAAIADMLLNAPAEVFDVGCLP